MKIQLFILLFFVSLNGFAQNVGINTPNPTNDLSVNGDADITGKLGIGINSPHTNFQTEITGTTTWGGGILARGNTAGVVLGQLNGVAQIGGHNAAATDWVNLAINSGGGNVGIGTSTPTEKLEVNGNARIIGDLMVTGNVTGTIPGMPISVTINVPSFTINANGQVGISFPFAGAIPGMAVIITPPFNLPNFHAIAYSRVTANNIVWFVIISNNSSSQTYSPGLWRITLIP